MKETLKNQKTESKISVEARILGDDTIYFVKTKKNQFEVTCKGDGSLLITADAKTMNSAIGGRGEDNKKDAWIGDKHFKTKSEVASSVLELLISISK